MYRSLALVFLVGCASGASLGDRCARAGDCSSGQICGPDATCILRPECVTIFDCPTVTPCAVGQCVDGTCQYERGSECLPGETCTLGGCASMFDGGPDAGVDAPGFDAAIDAACAPPTLSCDGECVDPETNADHCGGCGEACDPAGAMACQAAPVCTGGECGFELRPADTLCRMASCEGDLPEVCDGASPECPAACGCEGEPCCVDACATDLVCSDGVCTACTLSMPTVSGVAGMMGGSAFKGVRGAGEAIELIALDDTVHTIALGGGARAMGEFTAGGYLTGVDASGDQLGFLGNMGMSGALTIEGASVSGSGTAPPLMILGMTIPGLTNRVEGSGNTLTFYSSTGVVFATVTFSSAEICP